MFFFFGYLHSLEYADGQGFVKGKFLYNAVTNPQELLKALFTSPPGRPVHSEAISTYLGSIVGLTGQADGAEFGWVTSGPFNLPSVA